MPESEKDPILNDAERQRVNGALEAILATEKFEAAPQMSAFLRYVVEQAADGNQNRIKAFTVAVDALGKPDSFDPQNDPVVRVLAGRLRAALTAYNDENTDATLVITMTPGSYVPKFLKQQLADEQDTVTAQTTNVAPASNLPENTDDAQKNASHTNEWETNFRTQETINQKHNQSGATHRALHGNADSIKRKPETPAAHSSPSDGIFGKMASALTQMPKLALAGALAAAVVIAVVHNNADLSNEPDLQAATLSSGAKVTAMTRSRPKSPSVFISAVDRGNALENSLNAVVSGVISESERVKVYRILDLEHETQYWPEDYILTLTTLELPDEARINIQLMDAQTGRIVHSQAIGLNEEAFEQLTQKELSNIIDSARAMVSVDGPLVNDYSTKEFPDK